MDQLELGVQYATFALGRPAPTAKGWGRRGFNCLIAVVVASSLVLLLKPPPRKLSIPAGEQAVVIPGDMTMHWGLYEVWHEGPEGAGRAAAAFFLSVQPWQPNAQLQFRLPEDAEVVIDSGAHSWVGHPDGNHSLTLWPIPTMVIGKIYFPGKDAATAARELAMAGLQVTAEPRESFGWPVKAITESATATHGNQTVDVSLRWITRQVMFQSALMKLEVEPWLPGAQLNFTLPGVANITHLWGAHSPRCSPDGVHSLTLESYPSKALGGIFVFPDKDVWTVTRDLALMQERLGGPPVARRDRAREDRPLAPVTHEILALHEGREVPVAVQWTMNSVHYHDLYGHSTVAFSVNADPWLPGARLEFYMPEVDGFTFLWNAHSASRSPNGFHSLTLGTDDRAARFDCSFTFSGRDAWVTVQHMERAWDRFEARSEEL